MCLRFGSACQGSLLYYPVYLLRRWERRLFMRWGLSSFILRIIKVLFSALFISLLIFLPILGINSVYAQDPTFTPTWQPLFPTSTPRPTINSICPEGQPIGWGTVTPSFKWNQYCSNCIIYPTADWSNIPTVDLDPFEFWHGGYCSSNEEVDGCQTRDNSGLECWCPLEYLYPDGTPTPTGLYNPYPNGTPTPQTSNNYYLGQKITLGSITWNYLNKAGFITKSVGTYPSWNECGAGYQVGRYVLYDYSFDWVAGDTALDSSFWDNMQYYDGTNIRYMYWARDHYISIPGVGTVDNVVIGTMLTDNGVFYNGFGRRVVNGSSRTDWYRADYKSNLTRGVIDYHPICYGIAPTATPYPTPQMTPTINTGADYCAEVEAEPSTEEEEIGISLPTPIYGEGQCVIIGNFSIDLGWLSSIFPTLFTYGVPDELGVPGFQICVRPISFGNINLFGLLVNVDYFILVGSLVMVLRWILRS